MYEAANRMSDIIAIETYIKSSVAIWDEHPDSSFK